jgi:hypothetical protein
MRAGQREYFYSKLDELFPGLRQKYQQRYGLRYECPSPDAARLTPPSVPGGMSATGTDLLYEGISENNPIRTTFLVLGEFTYHPRLTA